MSKKKTNKKLIAFKVRDRATGLFLCAGQRWGKFGKVWANIGHLKLSIGTMRMLPQYEIVVLEANPKTINCDIVISSGMKSEDILEMIYSDLGDSEEKK